VPPNEEALSCTAVDAEQCGTTERLLRSQELFNDPAASRVSFNAGLDGRELGRERGTEPWPLWRLVGPSTRVAARAGAPWRGVHGRDFTGAEVALPHQRRFAHWTARRFSRA
jgi:hypothetical protein